MLKEILAKIYLLQVSKKKDAELLWLATYQYLCGDQIIAILKIIDAEVVKSFHFGLKLSHDHLFKEKAAVLCILNQMGNLDQIPEKADYEEVYKIFSKALRKVMEEKPYFISTNWRHWARVGRCITAIWSQWSTRFCAPSMTEKFPIPKKR